MSPVLFRPHFQSEDRVSDPKEGTYDTTSVILRSGGSCLPDTNREIGVLVNLGRTKHTDSFQSSVDKNLCFKGSLVTSGPFRLKSSRPPPSTSLMVRREEPTLRTRHLPTSPEDRRQGRVRRRDGGLRLGMLKEV